MLQTRLFRNRPWSIQYSPPVEDRLAKLLVASGFGVKPLGRSETTSNEPWPSIIFGSPARTPSAAEDA